MGCNNCALFAILLASSSVFFFIPTKVECRAFFVFGDSLVDVGNNNYLATQARADAPPYGIDYPTHAATGRFSNGFNIPDLISQRIGASESALPYLSPQLEGERLLVGANFASAGVGILNDTGAQFVNIIKIGQQLQFFEQYQQRVAALIGEAGAQQLVAQSLTLVTLGGNDFVNNYYLVPNSARSRQFTIPNYVPFLISEFRKVLLRLYELGPRRVIVTGTGPIGCTPAERAQRGRNGACSVELQQAAGLFNSQLEAMLLGLNSQLGDNIFIAANTQLTHYNFISNPQAYGFVTASDACCGQGPNNGLGLCTPISNLCPDRDTYAFWDPFHPSERANKFIVSQITIGSVEYMNPMNLSTILALDSRT